MDTTAREEWRRHWTVVLSATAGIALISVPSYSIGLFFEPLEKEFGWSRAAISSGPMITAMAGIAAGPFIGLLVDRIGPRRFAMLGVLLFCCAISLLSVTQASLWTWWTVWSGLAVAGFFTKPLVWTLGVSSFFNASRGLALAITYCGPALASAAAPILANLFISSLGWRMAFVALGASFGAICIPLVLLFFSSAQDQDRKNAQASAQKADLTKLPGYTVREGLLSWRFVRLAIAGVASVWGTYAFIVNLAPILISQGHSRAIAASLAGSIGLITIGGKLFSGYLVDRINGSLVAAMSMTLPIISLLLLLSVPGNLSVAIAASVILGIASGASVTPFLTTKHFGLRSFGTLFGTISGIQALAVGLGPLVINHVYDKTGSYAGAMLLLIPVCLAGIVFFLSLGKYPEFPVPESAKAPANASENLSATPTS